MIKVARRRACVLHPHSAFENLQLRIIARVAPLGQPRVASRREIEIGHRPFPSVSIGRVPTACTVSENARTRLYADDADHIKGYEIPCLT